MTEKESLKISLTNGLTRQQIRIHGAVQGVGFRPFVYRLARELNLTGWVRNNSQGVVIEAEGDSQTINTFLLRLRDEPPPGAIIHSISRKARRPTLESGFTIIASDESEEKSAWIMPDTATCADCRREIFDPGDRRYLYPFTNCTHCGPRYTIIRNLPYDRPNTTMREFTLCPECQQEYDDPGNRRFHAQPNACPKCGPYIKLLDAQGKVIAERTGAIEKTLVFLQEGAIIALKGLGGFQLLADAANDSAIQRLRRAKQRDEKPFAMMFPDLQSITEYCHVSTPERKWLLSREAPIVLLQRKRRQPVSISPLSAFVAPGNSFWGIMLPYTPLHHILLRGFAKPVVATSGNISDEPICIDNHDAQSRLAGIADYFLVHNRPIVRYVDDSIVRTIAGSMTILRRARGYAPLPVTVNFDSPPALAVGGHLKNTIALSKGRNVFISQHIGDLETPAANNAFTRTIQDLSDMYHIEPQMVLHDKHPDYVSTRQAQHFGKDMQPVQHHVAHILAAMAENKLKPPLLGIAWDGAGLGDDGSIWGSEFITITKDGYERVAHLRPFPLPGGDMAAKEPRRTALGLLHTLNLEPIEKVDLLPTFQAFTGPERKVLLQMLDKNLHSPITSSMGRLFDAAASLLGIQQINHYEGQAAMQLEQQAWKARRENSIYPYQLMNTNNKPLLIDWAPLVNKIITGYINQIPIPIIAARFHNTLADMILKVAQHNGLSAIVLSGGTFQNRLLTEKSVQLLKKAGFKVFLQRQIPPNDGGICLGQIMALHILNNKDTKI